MNNRADSTTDDYYRILNGSAHRKVPELVGAPALVWHQAFWNAQHVPDDKKKRDDRLRDYVNSMRQHIRTRYDPHTLTSTPIVTGQHRSFLATTLSFSWGCLRVKVRVDNHTEYVAITSIIDASIDVTKEFGAKNPELCPNYMTLKDALERFRLGTSLRPHADPDNKFPDVAQVHAFLYTTLWEQFANEVLSAGASNGGYLKSAAAGFRFADLRGLITCEQYPPDGERRKPAHCARRLSDEVALEFKEIQAPFYRRREDEGRREENHGGTWHRNGYPSAQWARQRLNGAWRFLSLAADPAEPENDEGRDRDANVRSEVPIRTEFTVSRFLHGRALLASALGPQEGPHDKPVLFYVHTITQCERQIGRLVDRLNQNGTLRLAAIIALPYLPTASDMLYDIEECIRKTRNEITDLSKFGQGTDRKVLEQVNKIQKNIAELSSAEDGFDSGIARLGSASLEYRLVRSRYYKESLDRQIKDVRIRRLEGYLPYDEFIDRRLRSAFGLISSIEERFANVQNEWRALAQLYLATVITQLTGGISKQEKAIVSIQDVGEFVLFFALVPHYLSTILNDLVGCPGDGAACAIPVPVWHVWHLTIHLQQIIQLVMLLLSAAIFFGLRRNRKKADLH